MTNKRATQQGEPAMLLDDTDPGWQLIDQAQCPHCHAVVPDELVMCSHCGRHLRGFAGTFVNEMRQFGKALLAAPTWMMILGCLLVGDVLVLLLAWAFKSNASHAVPSRSLIGMLMLGIPFSPLLLYLLARKVQASGQRIRLKGRPHTVNISYDE